MKAIALTALIFLGFCFACYATGPIDLARADRDKPGDNEFVLSGAKYTEKGLADLLSDDRVATVLNRMRPSTDDPTFRNVALTVNGTQLTLSFEKSTFLGWTRIDLTGVIHTQPMTCGNPKESGTKLSIQMTGDMAGEAQDYVSGVEIRVCARETGDAAHPALDVKNWRVLYPGAQYEPWIALLFGDFLRPFGGALSQALQSR